MGDVLKQSDISAFMRSGESSENGDDFALVSEDDGNPGDGQGDMV